jgi:uncharacterized protein (TIGR02452 family)
MSRLAAIAQSTVKALENGWYENEAGQVIDIAPLVKHCRANTQCYDPDTLTKLRDQVLAQPAAFPETEIELVNETTLKGCERLTASGAYPKITALNFASAKNPGGGFLGGAKAQEESLARSSGLYHSLLTCPEYYSFHRNQRTCLYSDRMIYSPHCPVFRMDDGSWLDEPYLVSFITSPAPNAGAIKQNEARNLVHIPDTFRERLSKVLALAVHHGCDVMVLGAWGCGAFMNNPDVVAGIFAEYLKPGGAFWGRIPKVLFSVLDTRKEQATYGAFAKHFGDTKQVS